MQHFAAALHLSDVVTKLHTLTLLGVIDNHTSAPPPLTFVPQGLA